MLRCDLDVFEGSCPIGWPGYQHHEKQSINKYYWTFPQASVSHVFFFVFFLSFCCLLGKEVKIKDLVKEQPSTFRPKPQKLISQSGALRGSAFSTQLQVLMLMNGFSFLVHLIEWKLLSTAESLAYREVCFHWEMLPKQKWTWEKGIFLNLV